MYTIQFIIFALIVLLSNSVSCQSNTTTNNTASTTKTTTISTTTTTVTTPQAVQLASTCTLNQASPFEKSLLTKVLTLDKKKFSWEDKDHLYYFGVCTEAEHAKNVNEAFVQINKQTNVQIVLGRLDDVDIEGFGTESKGIRIFYKHGDKYKHACNKAERNSVLYILCNPNNSSDVFEMIEENNNREGDSCSYIFQLKTPLMCTENNSSSTTTTTKTTVMTTNSPSSVTAAGNATGTTVVPGGGKANKIGFVVIVLFVVFGVMFVYFLVGTMYMRYVRQARGIEQLPHHEVWQSIGAKSTECCSYVFRCGKVRSEVRNYEHISDRLSDDDENLLNM